MKNLFKRLFALFICVLLVFPMAVQPAQAAEFPDDGVGFWRMMSGWVGVRAWKSFLDIGVTEETATEEDWRDAYERYTDDLRTKTGTATVIDGGVRLYFSAQSITGMYGGDLPGGAVVKLGDPFGASYSGSSSSNSWVTFAYIQLPYNCTYSFGASISVDNFHPIVLPASSSGGGGTSVRLTDSSSAAYKSVYAKDTGLKSFAGRAWIDCIPYTGVLGDYYDIDVGPNSRVGTITGDFGVIGDNNQLIKSEQNYVVNETNNTVYNPVTGETHNITNWAYDYSTRSYDLTIDTGDKITVTYGDTHITIKQGDTIHNVYYMSDDGDGGGGSGGDGEDKDSIWDKFVKAILFKIFSGFIALVDMAGEKLQSVLTGILSFFDAVPLLFGGFLSFFGELFSFLPKEILDLIYFGFFCIILAGLIKVVIK